MAERALVFDIGNVLVTFDFTRASRIVAAKSDVDAGVVLKTISEIKDELESGRMGEDEFFSKAMRMVGFRGEREEFELAWCDIFEENTPMRETLDALPKDLRLILLSNTNEPHKRWLLGRFGVFKCFEGGVFSHEAKCMKPDDGIYRQLMEGFGLEPGSTFYIDDLPANIEAGRRWGLASHQYAPSEHARFQQDLDAWLSAY